MKNMEDIQDIMKVKTIYPDLTKQSNLISPTKVDAKITKNSKEPVQQKKYLLKFYKDRLRKKYQMNNLMKPIDFRPKVKNQVLNSPSIFEGEMPQTAIIDKYDKFVKNSKKYLPEINVRKPNVQV